MSTVVVHASYEQPFGILRCTLNRTIRTLHSPAGKTLAQNKPSKESRQRREIDLRFASGVQVQALLSKRMSTWQHHRRVGVGALLFADRTDKDGMELESRR